MLEVHGPVHIYIGSGSERGSSGFSGNTETREPVSPISLDFFCNS